MLTIEFDHYDCFWQFNSKWRQTSKLVNLKISAMIRVYDLGKIWKWLKLLNSIPFIKKTLKIMFTFEFYHFKWLSQFYSEWRQTSKLKISQ